ncbi:MAG: YbaB/EbfC family nucleoid-associated protein [Nitrospiraceae bacterium]
MSKNPFSNMAGLMKQAQAMQDRMAKIQEEASKKEVTGSAGGGIVTVTATGGMQVTSVKIDAEVVKSGDVEMLQDLTLAATNEALRKAREMMSDELKSLTGGLNIPGLM